MKEGYTYGPLKSNYFSQFEKIWLEGLCKERGLILDESNLSKFITDIVISKKAPTSVFDKCERLVNEAGSFSVYMGKMFTKTWDRILSYGVKAHKTDEKIDSNQLDPAKQAMKWWLKQAPSHMSSIIEKSYFDSILYECIFSDPNVLDDLKNLTFKKNSPIFERVKTSFVMENDNLLRLKFRNFPNSIPKKEVLLNESILNVIPSSEKIVDAALWLAETIHKIENTGKRS